ncbi:MRP family ATP-binding protein [Kyrpidia spormannii]|uniref:Iron-sulfur cluster carrier protein n=1 Tax=Kyrpidia spormannii TaxID=2055160 RepID=A0A2K8N3D0_9BACL|nr:Mrp/NBP35 family ATP-binding protein [Kyrpidia spormannii]ATY83725.1 MRP family ATP-binding protein [Kyrpidia spormannii]
MAALTEKTVFDALRPIQDPEAHRSIVDLGMVRKVEIDGGFVTVEVALTIKGCPLHTVIQDEVEKAVRNLPGVTDCRVILATMTGEERARFRDVLQGGTGAERSQGVEGVPPLLRPNVQTRFVAVTSGKGGVGKSTVTANLALALARDGYRVGVIDADIYGFSIPGLFGAADRKPTVIDELIMPVQAEGVKIMSMNFFVPENTPVIWRGPMLGKMLRNFFAEVHWGDLDVMLLDLPPGTGDVALDVHQLLPKAGELIVTTPQRNAADVAVRAGMMAKKTGHEILGVVENMAYRVCPHCGGRDELFGRGGGQRVADELKVKVLAQIPLQPETLGGTGLYEPDTPAGQAFDDLAKIVGGLVSAGLAG